MGGLTSFRCGNGGGWVLGVGIGGWVIRVSRVLHRGRVVTVLPVLKRETITFKNTDKDQPVKVKPHIELIVYYYLGQSGIRITAGFLY